jgi:hypothetical protein
MSTRELQQSSERIRERAGRQYIADRAKIAKALGVAPGELFREFR